MHSLLGSTASSARNKGSQIVQIGGMYALKTSSGGITTDSNINQLNAMKKAYFERWHDPKGEGYQWADAAGIDHNNLRNQDEIIFNSMIKTKRLDETGESYNFLPGQTMASPAAPTSIFGEDYNTKEVGGKDSDYKDIEKIGRSKIDSKVIGYDQTTHEPIYSKELESGKFTSSEIKDPRTKMLYENVFKNATTGKGIMLDGKLVHISEDLKKLGKDDPKVAAQILRSIKQTPPIALTSRLLTTNQILDSQGFVAGLGKEQKTIDTNIRRQLQRDDASGRKLIDPKTHKPISWNEASEKYGLESINDVNYQGQISAHNWEETSSLGSNSKFSPHLVTIKDKDGKWHSFQTTRISGDNVGGNIARQNDLQDNFRTATINYNNYIPFKSKSKAFDGIEVMYNPSSVDVDNQTGEQKNWTIKVPNQNPVKVTESQYMNWVNTVK